MSNPGPAVTTATAYGFGPGAPAQIGATSATPVGFFGATPIVQPSSSSQAAVISTAPVSISATQWGFSTSTQAQSIIDGSLGVRAALVSLGLIKGSA